MRNRAKCKLCNSVIESFHRHDYVTCSCEEIAVDGGNDYHKCMAKNWDNFLRLDDLDNIIIPKIIEKPEEKPKEEIIKEVLQPTKQDLIKLLDNMIETYENLPSNAMSQPPTHYDLLSFALVIRSIFKT